MSWQGAQIPKPSWDYAEKKIQRLYHIFDVHN
jgi:hypothetical protein